MKSLFVSAIIVATAVTSVSFAQCRKSGGSDHPSPRAVYRPLPIHKTNSTKALQRQCHIEHTTQPVVTPDPAPVHREKISVGQPVTISGRYFGDSKGFVILQAGQHEMYAQITSWKNNEAQAVLPILPLSESTPATVVVRNAYRQTVARLQIELMPRSVPAPPAPQEAVVTPGQTVSLEGQNFGYDQGQIRLSVSGLVLNADVRNWTKTGVVAVLPSLQLAKPVKATISIVKADGQVADQLPVLFSPANASASVARSQS